MLYRDIVISGLDRTGKSTLISNLWTYYNTSPNGCSIIRGDKMQKNIVPTEEHRYLYMNSINYAFKNMKLYRDQNIPGTRLYDRLHIDEAVYGAKYRKYKKKDISKIYDLEKDYVSEFDEESIFLIVLVDEPANLLARDDGLGFTSDITEIAEERVMFIDAFNKTNIKRSLLLNIHNYSIEEVFEIITKFVASPNY
jgi:hypothetical protein